MKFNKTSFSKFVFQVLKENENILSKDEVKAPLNINKEIGGLEGLSDKDLILFKKLNLAKTLARLREKKKGNI